MEVAVSDPGLLQEEMDQFILLFYYLFYVIFYFILFVLLNDLCS